MSTIPIPHRASSISRRGKDGSPIRPWLSEKRRANPRAAADGGTVRRLGEISLTCVGMAMLALLCLLLICPVASKAGEPAQPAFAKANSLYDTGNFSEAATEYQREAHAGRYSANLFFNLGNTYYRLGDLGRAVINYQRALLLQPGHAEAAYNLAYVRGKTTLRTSLPDNLLGQLQETLGTLDVNTYSLLAAVSGWLAAAGFCLVLFTRGWRITGWLTLGVMLPVFAACVATLFWLDDGHKNPDRAIVLKDQAPAHYAPADSAKVITKIPVGDEVRVLSERGEWVYIQLRDGTRAWLLADAVERIIPSGLLPQGSTK